MAAPLIIVLAAPRRFVRLVAATVVCLVGLLWLDGHVATPAPYDDDGIGDVFGQAIIAGWVGLTMIGLMLRTQGLLVGDPDRPRHRLDRFWPLPLGFLFAVLRAWQASDRARFASAWPLRTPRRGSARAALVPCPNRYRVEPPALVPDIDEVELHRVGAQIECASQPQCAL